jgi:hypothetical protein
MANMPGGPNGAQAVAGKIMASEADAKARVAAVEYLGTADCARWPEARDALKAALRADPNECVRYAAAIALNSGCCCSKEMIESLRICVASTTEDGNAAESSPRVKAAAFTALQNCLMRVPPDVVPTDRETGQPPVPPEPGTLSPIPPPPPPAVTPERPASNRSVPPPTHLAAAHFQEAPRPLTHEQQLRRKTYGQTVDDARRTLFHVSQQPPQSRVLPPGKQTVLHALIKAREDVDARLRSTYGPPPPLPADPGHVQASAARAAGTSPAATVVNTAPKGTDGAVSRTSTPADPAPEVNPSPAPVSPSPAQVNPSPAPVSPSPAAVNPSPAPVSLSPAAVNPSSTPMGSSELYSESEPPVLPQNIYATPAPESPYRGGLLGALIRRARKQTDQ